MFRAPGWHPHGLSAKNEKVGTFQPKGSGETRKKISVSGKEKK